MKNIEPVLLGTSAPMRRLMRSIERVARFHTGVLVLGESGTGKELIARALHEHGLRRKQPFVAVNCATLGRDLLENELFGHERGAFTGANAQKKGLFELADGGSLFLDEVGEIDPSTQAKLLRVLERSEFRRVGGVEKLRVDVNVIAATNRDLRAAIDRGQFREDLYYRLKVVTLVVPPLRERPEDVPVLVHRFLEDFNKRHGLHIEGLTPAALALLVAHPWPGNVRELKNTIESAAMLTETNTLEPSVFFPDEHIAMKRPASRDGRSDANRDSDGRDSDVKGRGVEEGGVGGELRVALPATLQQVERALIEQTLRTTSSRAEAARQLGIGVRTLYTKVQAYRQQTR